MAVVMICVITAQKIKFSIKDFFSKYNQIRRKSLMKTLTFVQCMLKIKTMQTIANGNELEK